MLENTPFSLDLMEPVHAPDNLPDILAVDLNANCQTWTKFCQFDGKRSATSGTEPLLIISELLSILVDEI